MKNFTHLLRVRYSECDLQKIVFNGKYAEFVDIAATEYSRAVWGNYNDVLAMGVDSQVVNLNISWQAPSTFDDVLAIEVNTGKVGNSSYTFEFEIRNYLTGIMIASAQVIYVMVDATEFTKMRIPDDLRQKLEQGAPTVIVNHAGIDLANG
jgi:acyl-CoA thioester hydrolase